MEDLLGLETEDGIRRTRGLVLRLTLEQLMSADHWGIAGSDEILACGATIPVE